MFISILNAKLTEGEIVRKSTSKLALRILTVVCFLFTLSIAPKAFANNLLGNPGFENGIAAWFINGPYWSADTSTVYAGTQSVKNEIDAIAGVDDYFSNILQTYDCSVGQDIYATVYVKSEINVQSQAVAGLIVSFLDSSGNVIANSQVQDEIGGISDWSQLYIATTAPAGTAEVNYSLFVYAGEDDIILGGEAYFDEAVLSTDYIAPPPPPSNLINSGFENGLNDWTISGPPANWGAETTIVYSGDYSARNTIGTIPGYDYFTTLSQTTNYNPGEEVYATLHAKTEINPLSSGVAGLLVEFLNSDGLVIEAQQDQIGGSTDWSQLYVSAVAPVNTVQVRFNAFVYAQEGDALSIGGITYFDEAVLTDEYIPPPPSGLVNSDFENGLNGWLILGPPDWSVETDIVYAGSSSAKNTLGVISGEDYYGSLSQAIDFEEGEEVYATVQIKTDVDPLSSAVTGLLVQFLDASGNPIAGSDVQDQTGGTTDWRKLYVSAIAPVNTAQVRLSLFSWAPQGDNLSIGGEIYFDDAVLSTEYIEPPEFFVLLNRGFENGLFDWSRMGPNWEAQTEVVCSGNISAENAIGAIPGYDYYASLKQERDLIPGESVRAGVKIKTEFDSNSSALAGIEVLFLASDGRVIQEFRREITGETLRTEWFQLYFEDVAPANVAKVRLSIFTYALQGDPLAIGGIAYFDDVSLVISSRGLVKTEGRDLLADFDGNSEYEPYFIKGVGYSPYSIGRDPFDFGDNIYDDVQLLNRDFPLLSAMNANTIRIWEGNDVEQSGQFTTKITQNTLDTAEAHNIKVIAGFRIPTDINDFTDLAVRADLISRFGNFVDELKDHQAILFWNIGNENNLFINSAEPEQIKAFYSLVNEMAYKAREVEGRNYHPVSVVNGDLLYIGEEDYGTTDGGMVELDILGANVYRSSSFGDLFSDFAQISQKPFWISEFGVDAWHTIDPQNPSNGYEDQGIQAQWVGDLWDEIVARNDISIGGSVMEYSDEWWKPWESGTNNNATHDYSGHESTATPDGFINEEWLGIMAISQGAPNVVTPRVVYSTLQTKFALDAPYIIHIGIENGQDVFPQETAEEDYFTGAASTLMNLKYLDSGYDETQLYIYDTFHSGNPQEDMNDEEMEFVLDTEAPEGYSFGNHAIGDQADAIKDFIHWTDYEPLAEINVPSLIPTGGDYNWKVVRGFVTDIKPCPSPGTIPDFEFYGVWLNDPTVYGLGYDVYQTAQALQNSYLQVEGAYRSVCEPPENINRNEFKTMLKKAKMTIMPSKNSERLSGLSLKNDAVVKNKENLSASSEKEVSSFSGYLASLKEILPSALKGSPVFGALLNESRSLRRFDVYCPYAGEHYSIWALSNDSSQKANILIEVALDNGAFSQATWVDQSEIYPKISEEGAIRIAETLLRKTNRAVNNFYVNSRKENLSVSLIRTKRPRASRFYPSYKIEFGKGETVIVHQNGESEIVGGGIIPIEIGKDLTVSFKK